MRQGGGRRGEEPQTPEERISARTARPAPEQTTPSGTIDSLFGPLPPVESSGRVWLHVNGQLKPVRVRLGISDGTFTELLGGDLRPDTELVTNVITGQETQGPGAGGGRSPLLPQRPGGFRGGPPGVRNPAQPGPR